jgi:2-oxoglutarate dehydrogenase E2 component (dihydrolipoamide succinyltransferase)
MDTITDIIAPEHQEGTKATVLRWSKRAGERVQKDEPLLELETDKVVVEVPSPVSGVLLEIVKSADAEVAPGEILGRVREGAPASPQASQAPPQQAAAPISGNATARAALSPSVRALLAKHRLSAAQISGTGRNGRLTAQDVTRHVELSTPCEPVPAACEPGERVKHTAMRRRIAEHMVRSLAAAPHVTTLFEANLSAIVAHRDRHLRDYQARGAHLTLTAYFVSACSQALVQHRELNATFHEDALELHHDINIGVATALGNEGLIVPVLHRTQDSDLFGIAQALERLVSAARHQTLKPEEVRGGTFTISNHGVSGSLMAAPIIINQPQVAILGVGKAERRVCVVKQAGGEAIAIRTMAYLTLSIDHRAVDAFQANAFLGKVVSVLEQWPLED